MAGSRPPYKPKKKKKNVFNVKNVKKAVNKRNAALKNVVNWDDGE